ncbi:MAG TPA: c-type cytochrome domain-containing protein [Prolixibacteraceae bacterium]|nr:c-type cytochrome domain-containing protein [Prolixibacteraceae bacterium]
MKGKKTLRISILLVFAASVLVLVQTRCRHDDLNTATLAKVCYQTEIGPIFLRSCGTTGCHDSQRGKGGYSFTDYTSVMKAIKPFNAQKSKAYQAITGKAFVQLMPPSGALSQNERILIRLWIDQGAENTTCATVGTTGTTSGTVNNSSAALSDPVCFQRDLLPVLVSSCGTTGCHDQTSHKEGYTITSYASVMSNLVKAGSPTTSKLYTIIKNNSMPPRPYPALSTTVKDSIYNWIKNGALNGTCVSLCDTAGVVTYQNQIATLISKNCISCHSGSGASKGILLDTYTNVKAQIDNGKLLAAVKGTSIQMPPAYKITTCELREIELWKANGTLQN